MKIGRQEDPKTSPLRRWGVPLGVATGVTAVSVVAVAVLGGMGEATSHGTERALPGGNPSPTASPDPSASAGSTAGGTGSASADPASEQKAFTITSSATTTIEPGTVARILSSCLGADASKYDAVIAVRAPLATQNADGVVVAVDSAGQYVQCATKGDKGSSSSHPPTFINNRLWGTGRIVSYFETTMDKAGEGKYLNVGAGHYTSDVAKVTVSYGDQPKEYPVLMKGGAFAYTSALSPDGPVGPRYTGPNPYIHAYDASGKEIYNQAKDPQFSR
ncbi:hypothetical protein [Streptomyces sp. VRA16 Mangrove soil]|uniref:hypothetical protein n=1 Tax=Streptomyces sp. VRA16 Mangrove soil TaxID=2817434 RepID=UPI001A9F5E8C|nr:hypothetical protein [Streptomyces sp. VRA16 Mangrove soil]MBO1331237.1 hypothetical protein [Streptomyces sp. VRA16 Mangrove soil]